MTTKAKTTVTTKGAFVCVTDPHSSFCGMTGVVMATLRGKTVASVKLLASDKQIEVPINRLCLDSEVDRVAVLAARDAVRAEQEAFRQAIKAKRRAEYVEARRTATVTPLVRHTNDTRVCWGQQRDGYISDSVTIYTDMRYSNPDVPNVQVNWSAFGSVSPEEALAFAHALAAAAVEAMAIRAQQEQADGLTITTEE